MGKGGNPFLGGPSLKYNVAAVGDASKICAPMTTKPLSSFRIYEDYLHKHSNVPLSIPVESVPLHSSSCQPTWVNNGIPSTVVGGTVPASVSSSLVHTAPSAPTTFSIPVVQAVSDLRPTIVPPSGGIQQPQQSTTPTRSGPSGEQLAARQVMPRELPIFSGDPQDWPLFHSSFNNTTEACGYSDAENLARLQRCLKRLYRRPGILINSLLHKLRAVPSPKTENLQSQITFGLAVQNVVDHMTIANLGDHLWNPTLLHELVEKLPSQLKMQWSYFKNRYTCTNLAVFSAFMAELVVMASDVTLPLEAISLNTKNQKPVKDKPKLFVHSDDPPERKLQEKESASSVLAKKTCVYCDNANHEIAQCRLFKALDIDGKCKAVKHKNLCRSCLVPHRKWPCRTKKECGVDGCRIHHHTLLHSSRSTSLTTAEMRTMGSTGNASNVVHQNLHCAMPYSLFRYLPVTIQGNGQQIRTYAFLDDGSSSTLLESNIASALGITGITDNLCLSWTGNISREEKESQRVSLIICGGGKKFKLHNVRTVQELRLPTQTLCYEDLQRSFHHLKGLPIHSYTDATPGIIIGIEHVRLLTAQRVREGRDNDPVAMKTRLGWCVFGKNSDNTATIEQLNLHHDTQAGNRELHQWMQQFFALEESSVVVVPESEDEKRARQIMETTTRRVNGAFETGLLWKYNHTHFPDSYPMALRRLNALMKRFSKNSALGARVKKQIEEYEAKGYAHRITPAELQATERSKVWYLPLGVVQNPKKPDKLRLIWDAKARVGGTSFNDMLLKGPDLLVGLMSILLRFRQRNIAIVGDIKEMFHQIRIRHEDKQAQRFLFRQDPESVPQIYVMDVATFGATCSPCLAQFIKNKNANHFTESFPRAVKAITENHYVDDLLDSVDTVEEAVKLINEVKQIHSYAGFEIRNFCSNSAAVLGSIGEPGAPAEVSLNLENNLGTECVLGLVWRPTEDVFTFDLSYMKEEIKKLISDSVAPTKRQILRTVIAWEDSYAADLEMRNSYALEDVEAHLFVDASEAACAAVLYLRCIQNSVPKCALIAGKTKVAPLKPISVPRLELQAAMIGTRMMDSVLRSLDIHVSRRYLWSDSSTVLCWLRSDSRRYHQFVAVRVREILTLTNTNEWHSKINIADAATKWKEGPNFDPNDS
ncbi:uncharacterized protein LOC134204945 [Armigeres subalbatus]|uniref:uncharacterized protein LOC134204945 n=1 Tax=Armigeres subalbatus TaxID=124917 RepID=UPI002ED323CE